MLLGKRDKDVIRAFTEGRAGSSRRLDTDGKRLDGAWLGGSGIAKWVDGARHIALYDLGSRSALQVHRVIRKMVPLMTLHPDCRKHAM